MVVFTDVNRGPMHWPNLKNFCNVHSIMQTKQCCFWTNLLGGLPHWSEAILWREDWELHCRKLFGGNCKVKWMFLYFVLVAIHGWTYRNQLEQNPNFNNKTTLTMPQLAKEVVYKTKIPTWLQQTDLIDSWITASNYNIAQQVILLQLATCRRLAPIVWVYSTPCMLSHSRKKSVGATC